MFYSIIIPSYNRRLLLNKLIGSLYQLVFPHSDYEILIIDNNSQDGTRDLVGKTIIQHQDLSIKYINEKAPGLHNARHRGMMEAKGDVLCFLDDDVTVDSRWLEEISETFKSTDAVLVGGKVLPDYEVPPPSWIEPLWDTTNGKKILGILSLIDLGDDLHEVDPIHIYGCNYAIAKKTLIECNGFHPDSMPENLIQFRGDGETGLAKKIRKKGYTSIYNPKACVFHYVPKERMTLEYFCKRMFNQGISDSYTEIRKNRGIQNRIQAMINMAYLKGRIFHVENVLRDNDLLAWTFKEHYFPEK